LKNILWTVRYRSAPAAVRYCRHCGTKTIFTSSGLFRVNAQQKTLDVWLIFKCAQCKATWNLTIFSSVSPRTLPPALLDGFHRNDEKLAMRYATDMALIRKNGSEPAPPAFEILGESVEPYTPARIALIAEWPLACKAAPAIRGKLGLSKSMFDLMYAQQKIVCTSGQNLKKCGLTGTIHIELR
jgi:hypothetical protein